MAFHSGTRNFIAWFRQRVFCNSAARREQFHRDRKDSIAAVTGTEKDQFETVPPAQAPVP
jgi:hypothetical protein